jgi:hypothetical protein
MPTKPSDVGAEIRMAALLMSALVKASDEELSRLGEKRSLAIEGRELQRVRDLLREMARLLRHPDDERWEHVAAACDAILGAPSEEAPMSEDGEEEGAEAPPSTPEPDDVTPPPSLDELLSISDSPPPSIGDFPPSPWTEPSRAVQSSVKASAPAIPPPPVSEPAPPPMVTARNAEPPLPEAVDPPLEESTADEGDERSRTLPPGPMESEALPFPSGPNPETPETESLPPPALASVIAGWPPMTVVSYAALCASCEAMPQRLAETHAKFGITDSAARESLDAVWRSKLEEDARLHALWSALTEQFKTWLIALR